MTQPEAPARAREYPNAFSLCQSSLCILPPAYPLEAEMRTILATFAGLVALAAVSAQAAPVPPAKTTRAELGASPAIKLERQGCGRGSRRGRWRDLGLLALARLLSELVTSPRVDAVCGP